MNVFFKWVIYVEEIIFRLKKARNVFWVMWMKDNNSQNALALP